MIIKSEDDLVMSQVLIHMLGFQHALCLSILVEASKQHVGDSFKCPKQTVTANYDMTRHMQVNSIKWLENASILSSWAGETPKDGTSFKFNKDSMADLNYIIISVTLKDLVKFKFKTNKFVRKNLNVEKIKGIVNQF
tara:strand:- start:25270 stop:25680 length:411 start_codon:yes stop_codon:yes gene_type:complete